jgi:hypothetical protein
MNRLKIPSSAIDLTLNLFTARSNRVFTPYSRFPSYPVEIGIDQGEVISPLLWVIYLDPLLTRLNNCPTQFAYQLKSTFPTHPFLKFPVSEPLLVNQTTFMDDSTLISSSKEGMEYKLSLAASFYKLANIRANFDKFDLITTTTSVPVTFQLSNSSFLTLTPLPPTSSF